MSIKNQVLTDAMSKARSMPEGMEQILAEYVGSQSADLEAIATAALPLEIVRLRDAADFYQEECYRSSTNRAFLSGCIMAAAALECQLLILAFFNEDDVLQTSVYKNRKHQIGKASLTQLQFHELIALIKHFGWLPPGLIEPKWKSFLAAHRDFLTKVSSPDSGSLRKLPDDPGEAYFKFMQGVRNSIHGGRFVRSDSSPNRDQFDSACRTAILVYEELKEALAVQMFKDGYKMKRTRIRGFGASS